MAHIYRLIRFSAFVVFLLAGHAHAALSPVSQWRFPATGYNTVGEWMSTAEAACSSKVSSFASFGVTYATYDGAGLCSPRYSSGGAFSTFPLDTRSACPANSTGTTSCTCTAPYVESAGACSMPVDPAEEYCAQTAGSPVKQAWRSTSMAMTQGKSICASGGYGYYTCGATVDVEYCGQSADGSITCEGSGVSTGAPCTPAPDPQQPTTPTETATPFPDPPPPGTCPGTINGISVNVPCSSTSTKGTTTTETNDGAGNTTSKSESKSTTCTAAGSCTTTVTTTTTVNGGTPTTTTSTKTEGKGEFCAGNAGAKECGDGEGSSFGGSCDSSFVCTGDAVQCALTKEVHLQNCKLNKATDESALYTASKGEDADFDNDEVVNVGPGNFSTAPVLGAGSCISNKSITVMGSTIDLPFADVCQYLAMLGNVLMAVGYLLSARIIIRG